MILIAAFVLMAFGIFGLWWGVQKRLEQTHKRMQESFQSLSFEVMEKSSRSFLELAKISFEKYHEGAGNDLEQRQKAIEQLLVPIKESMQKLDVHQRELEKQREGAYASLSKQLDTMAAAERDLRKETLLLSQSLRSPQARGSWGELHLRRVVELAGLLNHCDFFEQSHMETESRAIRPDLIVRLPGQRQIAVDAKAPLSAYLDASDAGDEAKRLIKMKEHAQAIRKHMRELSAKDYAKPLGMAFEFVILFIPAEAFYSGALQADPSLIEAGIDQNIIVATPTTLIAILRAVAASWKQESISKSAWEIGKLGQDLYERIGILCEHWGKVGKGLNSAVESYNQSLASLESRVLVTARKLKETGAVFKEIIEPELLEKIARDLKVEAPLYTETT